MRFPASKILLFIFSFSIIFNAGCKVNDADTIEEPTEEIIPEQPPAFESNFSMNINGEDWEAFIPPEFSNTTQYTLPFAGLFDFEETESNADSLLFINNYKHLISLSLSSIDSYYEFVSFSFKYDENAESYSISDGIITDDYYLGATYAEYAGGDDIINYYSINDNSNEFTLANKIDEYGRRYIEGKFSFVAVVDSAKSDSTFLPYRFKPDTLQITNGKYILELKSDS
tara:strand:- start:4212 stop:4895 length:684 start_codon:yes stop_codon:yes gene_type:complete